ncbi:hypothetical protein C8D92_102482 [Tamilnaduibacter salinus]|uniref:Uncharacterized protein n=1 Tax=Tamilnaduibacter salinus TaxID=1484056 RepID=A0A2A2HZX3_9GAMM|nr:hypothetical protein [Tamilnaduibacter salinus]PAV24574.1 hypothetical protein CF392_15520 [Tamilnaduibacter salinus]PVY78435.1 hypothetical protein C8D92_102482 [Tamilnaduibacter salinus]
MPGWLSNRLLSSVLLVLLMSAGHLQADPRDLAAFRASKPLLLDIRYCGCRATGPEVGPSGVLPDFLDQSRRVTVTVSPEETGFLSVAGFSMGYALEGVRDAPQTVRFGYAGAFRTHNGQMTGQGDLTLVKGEWLHVFGSKHKSESGVQHTSVAVRVIDSHGS